MSLERQVVILRHVAHNQQTRLRHWAGITGDYSGSMQFDASARAQYARRVFDRYVSLGGLGTVAGLHVLELGPGDSLAVALLFAHAGAARVMSLDKFRYQYGPSPVYDELGVSSLLDRVEPRCGLALEEAGLEPESFDLIVSNAVLEELPDLGRSLREMHRVLRPGGVMLHQVDLSDYGIFSRRGFHPLEFLTVPDVVWKSMTDSCGGPNRQPVDFYRRTLAELGFDVRLLITHDYRNGAVAARQDLPEVDPEWLSPIRNRLLDRYRALPERELMVSGVFVRAAKHA